MGTIAHADLISTYDTRFQLERGQETVPFRLTRNMQSFIGPQGMEGMVVCAITAAAQALQSEPSATSPMIALFFRCLASFGRPMACKHQLSCLAQQPIAGMTFCTGQHAGVVHAALPPLIPA
jgi:hypothetical protein